VVQIREAIVLKQKDLLEIINNNQIDLRDRAFISFLYLTGARISEVLATIKDDIDITDDFIVIELITLKRRRMKNVKRIIGIPLNKEKDMINCFLRWLKFPSSSNKIFPFSRMTGWNIVNKWLGVYPHILRHTRLTHLVSKHNFTNMDLMEWTGWRNINMTTIYIHLRWQDLAEKLKK